MSQFELFKTLKQHISKHIIGQSILVDRLLLALLCDGHLLVEGAPGLAKTRAINVLSELIEGDFHRVQFTPDLLPADLTGTDIYRPQQGDFDFRPGPLFHNLVLADEINRSPAKVQAALLEAMAERQITVGATSYKLPELFLVMATQNPIEQEGTYPLPEAQLDRFLMHVKIDYPNAESEKAILRLTREEAMLQNKQEESKSPLLTQTALFEARQEILNIHMSDPLEDYLLQYVLASRDASHYGDDLNRWIEFGSSPRGSMALDRCARAHAWLNGRDYVAPEDIQLMAFDTLRHRILLSYEAEAEGITPEYIINELVHRIAVP